MTINALNEEVSTLTPKQRYCKKLFDAAAMVGCACGCGEMIKSVDLHGRSKRFVSGHNGQKYTGEDKTRWAAQKRYRLKNPDTYRDYRRDYYRARKLKAMAFMGNACHFCKTHYDGTNAPIFEFHHTDPTIKDDGITRMLTNKAWASVIAELEKCVLTCANCHNKFHGGEW